MLCQLSYASTCRRRKNSAGLMVGVHPLFANTLLRIYHRNSRGPERWSAKIVALEGEGKTALNAAFRLREVERAAILCDERTVALRKQIPHIDECFHAIRQHMAMNGLAHIKAEVRIGQLAVEWVDRRHCVCRLPPVGRTPLRAGLLYLAAHAGR